MASLLKSFYGDKATKDNDFGYAWLPKLDPTQDASWLNLFDQMYKGAFTGFFAWGMNPACSSANAGKVRQALAKLDWMVNVNVFDNETGSFWKGPGMDPKKIKTEVFHAAMRGLPRKRREHKQQRPLDAVEMESNQSSGSCKT